MVVFLELNLFVYIVNLKEHNHKHVIRHLDDMTYIQLLYILLK